METLKSFILKHFPALTTRSNRMSLEITPKARDPLLRYKVSVDYPGFFRVYIFDNSLRAFNAYLGELTEGRAIYCEVFDNVIKISGTEFLVFLKMLVTGKVLSEVDEARKQVENWRSSFSSRKQMMTDFKAVLEHLNNQ